jgi:hypothetical protein
MARLHKLHLIEREPVNLVEEDVFLIVQPDGWHESGAFATVNGRKFFNEKARIQVMVSYTRERDGRRWVHLSVSRPSRLPSYQDLKECRKLFLGTVRTALQLFVHEDEHVNDHPFCLHLWMTVDELGLPDFRWEDEKGGLTI